MAGDRKLKDIAVFERALDIIQRLQAGQHLTVKQIANIYDIHIRSAQRVFSAASIMLPVFSLGSGRPQDPYTLAWMKEEKEAWEK